MTQDRKILSLSPCQCNLVSGIYIITINAQYQARKLWIPIFALTGLGAKLMSTVLPF